MRTDGEAEAGGTISWARASRSGRNPQLAAQGAPTRPSDGRIQVAPDQDLIGQMTERGNMNAAWKRVRANGGIGGVDGLDMSATHTYL